MAVRPAAPWVRTRLRAAPLQALSLAVLVLVTAFLAGALPRAVEGAEAEGLRHALAEAGPADGAIEVLADTPAPHHPVPVREKAARPAALREVGARIDALLPAPLTATEKRGSRGVQLSEPLPSEEPGLPRPDGLPPRFLVAAQDGLTEHAQLVAGAWPRGEGVRSADRSAEAVVTRATAKAMRLKPGSVVHLPAVQGPDRAVKITGVVEPLAPETTYWSHTEVLRTPGLLAAPSNSPFNTSYYWQAALLLASEAGPFLYGLDPLPQAYWRISPDTSGLTARDVPALQAGLASLEGGPLQSRLRSEVAAGAAVSTGLDGAVDAFAGLSRAVSSVTAVALVGAGTVAGVVLLMAQALTATRRRPELTLLRARGASVAGIAGRLLAETAVVVLPAAAAGQALAWLLLPEARAWPSLAASAAVAALACLALPVRAALAHRTPRVHEARGDLVLARPSRRRTVAELCLLVLAAGAVLALRGGTDVGGPLVAAAPVLVAVIAALVLVRLYPLPLRLALRPLARTRGALGFLAVARTGRGSAAQVLPLLAVLTALTTAAFGGAVLAGIDDARDRAALLATGADARVERSRAPLPDGLADRVAAVDGVERTTAVHLDYSLALPDGTTVALAVVEPDGYARLTRETGLGAFDAKVLRETPPGPAATKDSGPVLSAVASPGTAELLGEERHRWGGPLGSFTLQVSEVRDTTPALPDQEFLVIDGAELPKALPTLVLATGSGLDTAALKKATEAGGSHTELTLRSTERAAFTDSPLQSGAERLYLGAVAAGVAFAALAVLLALLQSASERTALLARLRTMGLSARQGRRLLVLEALPQAVLAAAGCVLVGRATVALMADGVSLELLALPPGFDSVTAGLRADAWSLLLPAAGSVLLTVAVAAAQAWWTARRTAATELRAGDGR
ncbi:FtsX-like permease family protein [Streptomyces sp. EAG2]|uniref:FtsX-like permease family protein n=1 Tax=Streptomyces sp. EAG2 TaxID=2056495 RepID=UPI000C6CC3BF|nr:FtsX-like permease family protein [Streptomyces sp. EAG2]PKR42998.1 ABC transporter permease [Streptomyces sp. EAG2]